jgi:DnaA N-terminal domain
MDAERAWQSALGQLQLEMPKATFDTWVRDTRILSYQDGLFTIGVRNAYAREWLESRLSSTVTRLLMGIMNRSVEVRFVVSELESENNELPEPETCEPAESQDSTPEEDSVPAVDDELLVEAHYDLAYDEIVVPDHVTLVSRYFLRHLRQIGPELGWLYMGFRQAAFNAGARRGSTRERFSGKTIAGLSGIAESTFWNRIGKAETWDRLKGLVTTSAATPEWDTHSTTPRRLPRKYIVSMTLPLTAADARSLRNWLRAGRLGVGGAENILAAAAETPIDELLPLGAQAQPGDASESVISIVRSLFADSLPAERLESLSTRLHKHIMPDRDLLGPTHFFVEHVLPHLGTGPGWMLTLIRDRCYVNRETGEVRNQVIVQGGYAEVAGWLGLTRPKTIWEWLYGKHSASRGKSKQGTKGGMQRGPGRQATEIGKLINPVLRIYLRETTKGKTSAFSSSPRTFDVLLEEVPEELLAASQNEWTCQVLTCAMAREEGDLGAVCRIAKPDSGAVCSIGMARFVDDPGAVCSVGMARFVDDLGAVCRVFKSLNYLNPITNDSPTTPLSPNSSEKSSRQSIRSGGGMGNQAFWDFNFLMQNNQVAKARDIQKRQKTTGASIETLAQGFVSWLLYAYSPSGRRIENPVALAAKRLLENVHTGAGGDFDRMACLKPYELKALFDHDLAGDLWEVSETIEKSIYVVNYEYLAGPYKRELYRRLFGAQSEPSKTE